MARSPCGEYRRLIVVFREIGDCLAFTYLDKYDIKPMAFKQSPGFVSGKKGTRFERRCLRRIFANGTIAILNDLTNCLRYGDLTVPVGGMPNLMELKSGKASGWRDDRQIERLSRLSVYLTTDRVTDWYHPGVMTHSQSSERRSTTAASSTNSLPPLSSRTSHIDRSRKGCIILSWHRRPTPSRISIH